MELEKGTGSSSKKWEYIHTREEMGLSSVKAEDWGWNCDRMATSPPAL